MLKMDGFLGIAGGIIVNREFIDRQLKWDRRFLELAKMIASWSKDPSTKVGAVIVNQDNLIVGTGFNGFPKGCSDSKELYDNRQVKYKRVIHAEINALLTAGERARGAKIYIWPTFAVPNICCDCCKTAIQARITEVIGYKPTETPEDLERRSRKRSDGVSWEESIATARDMCNEAGIIYRTIEENFRVCPPSNNP